MISKSATANQARKYDWEIAYTKAGISLIFVALFNILRMLDPTSVRRFSQIAIAGDLIFPSVDSPMHARIMDFWSDHGQHFQLRKCKELEMHTFSYVAEAVDGKKTPQAGFLKTDDPQTAEQQIKEKFDYPVKVTMKEWAVIEDSYELATADFSAAADLQPERASVSFTDTTKNTDRYKPK